MLWSSEFSFSLKSCKWEPRSKPQLYERLSATTITAKLFLVTSEMSSRQSCHPAGYDNHRFNIWTCFLHAISVTLSKISKAQCMTQPFPLLLTTNLQNNHGKALSFYRANRANEIYSYIKALYCSLMAIIHQTEYKCIYWRHPPHFSNTYTFVFYFSYRKIHWLLLIVIPSKLYFYHANLLLLILLSHQTLFFKYNFIKTLFSMFSGCG